MKHTGWIVLLAALLWMALFPGAYADAPGKSADGFYELKSAQHLWWFAEQVNGKEGQAPQPALKARLMADIDVYPHDSLIGGLLEVNPETGEATEKKPGIQQWVSLGTKKSPFVGEFEGNGYVISGLYVNQPGAFGIGLIGHGRNAVVKNLTIQDAYFRAQGQVGSIAGILQGTDGEDALIENVSFDGYVVGVCGDHDYTPGGNVGGIVGYAEAAGGETSITIQGGRNHGTVICLNRSWSPFVGGVVGKVQYTLGGVKLHVSVKSCTHDGIVRFTGGNGNSERGPIGGVIGGLKVDQPEHADSCTFEAYACINEGSIDTWGSTVGGIIGSTHQVEAKVRRCRNFGALKVNGTGNARLGGVVGEAEAGLTIEECYNAGNLSASWGMGGILGVGNAHVKILNSYNVGDIEARCDTDVELLYAGGIAGDGAVTITDCYSAGHLSYKGTHKKSWGAVCADQEAQVKNSYYRNGFDNWSGKGKGLTMEEMTSDKKWQQHFKGFSTSVWEKPDNQSGGQKNIHYYPKLTNDVYKPSVVVVPDVHIDDIPQTGDSSRLGLWLLMVIVSVTGLTAIGLRRIRNRK